MSDPREQRIHDLQSFIRQEHYAPSDLLADLALIVSREMNAFVNHTPNTKLTFESQHYEALSEFRQGLRAAYHYLEASKECRLVFAGKKTAIQVVISSE